MPAKRLIAGLLLVLGAATAVVAPWAAPDRKPPRIVSAVMQDVNRDARADSLRITYSLPVRHALDRDGRYPFAVVGYRIRSVGASSRKALVIRLVEKVQPDPTARPAIRYRPTRSKPVLDLAGKQAAAQLFRGVKAHRRLPQPTSTTTTTTTATTTTTTTPTTTGAADADRDGYPDTNDCSPSDAKVHPGAPDLPDLSFVDSNCDGIDGTEEDAIFASPTGSDTNPGTRAKPKRQIQAAITAAADAGKDVYAAAGVYERITVVGAVDVYGGYGVDSWERALSLTTSIVGVEEGVYANGATRLVLQHLTVHADAAGVPPTAYGIVLLNGSHVTLQRVVVSASDGRAGLAGSNGLPGLGVATAVGAGTAAATGPPSAAGARAARARQADAAAVAATVARRVTTTARTERRARSARREGTAVTAAP